MVGAVQGRPEDDDPPMPLSRRLGSDPPAHAASHEAPLDVVEPGEPSPWRRRAAWAALGVAALLLVAGIGAGTWWLLSRDAQSADYMEVFITDLPAEITALDITVSGVYIGDGNHSLIVHARTFDVAALRGPGDALRVASGFIPHDADRATIRIVFASAVATIAGHEVPLPIPDAMLTIHHGLSGLGVSSAILLDLDLDASLVPTATGYAFRPYVSAVYSHQYADKPGRAADGGPHSSFHAAHTPRFDDKPPSQPHEQSTSEPGLGMGPRGGDGGSGGGSGVGSGGGGGASEPGGNIAPDLGNQTSSGGQDVINETVDLIEHEVGVIIQFTQGQGAAITDYISSLGAIVFHTYASGDALYAHAPLGNITAIAQHPDIVYIEKEKPVDLHLATSKQAIRAAGIGNLLTGLKDAAGNPIDGRGVGVAVIDTGIDGLHPDLPYNTGLHPDPAVMRNLKIGSLSYQLHLIPMANTDTTSGHGTHVAGIVAGRGTADGSHQGVAPGAKLYGLGVGELSTTLWTNQGLDWVRLNHDKVDPPIRVVSNSWSTGTTYDPNAYSSRIVRDLVDAGVVVVFSAGNDGGDGSTIRTSAEGQNRAEGVIMVANYNDFDDGRRDGSIAGSSSRGSITAPASWPDVSAPGVRIMSAKATVSSGGLGLFENYKELSGTSMAAPHVAGVVALMLQANPDLTPAQVERLVEQTAHAFTGGGAYATSTDARYNGSHYAKGHGMVDARAAVEAALAF